MQPVLEFMETFEESQQEISKGSRKKFLEEWLQYLKERQYRIISLRYGLEDGEERTLEEVSKEFEITRERIRQIEKKGKVKLKQILQGTSLNLVTQVINEAINNSGGIATEDFLLDALSNEFNEENLLSLNYLRLIMDVMDEFYFARTIHSWAVSKEISDLCLDLSRYAVNLLEVEFAPLPTDRLLEKLRGTELFQGGRGDSLKDDFIIAALNSDSRIVCFDDGNIGLSKWERGITDDIIMALRRLGKPSHFTKIAEEVNASLDHGKHVSTRAVHGKLCNHPDLFVWVGKRGTYGLKEWGIERSLTYIEAIEAIITNAGNPLTYEEILRAMPSIRKYYDESSIMLTLYTTGRFKNFPEGTFGLAEWNEDDFLTSDYRVKRLFDGGEETLPARKPKKDVDEAINSVDAFIFGLRGKNL